MTRVLLVPDLPVERWPSMDRYASRLARHLPLAAPDVEVTLAGAIGDLTIERRGRGSRVRTSGPVTRPALPTPGFRELRRYLARYWSYPRRVRRHHGDVLHVLDHSYAHVLVGRRRPAVVTVHDLLPVLTVRRPARGLWARVRNWLLQRVLDGLRTADGWIVATEWLRGELATWLRRDDRIHVIPFGVDDAFFEPPPTSREETRRRWDLPQDAFVVLHVGSVGPRKNLPTVIGAVHGLRRAGVNAWLLQVGGEFEPVHHADLEARALVPYVRTVGEAHETELRAAYRAADVLLFPSHYEGFGFPVLEAMASELPVVTSGAGGLAEVAGDAAVVVGGRETEPYVAALTRLVRTPAWRDQLVQRGAERARRFRWTEMARRTAEVYRALA